MNSEPDYQLTAVAMGCLRNAMRRGLVRWEDLECFANGDLPAARSAPLLVEDRWTMGLVERFVSVFTERLIDEGRTTDKDKEYGVRLMHGFGYQVAQGALTPDAIAQLCRCDQRDFETILEELRELRPKRV